LGAPSSEYPRGFGNYVLLQAMAHGGMGEVYLAKHGGIAGLDRLCVLKKLRPDLNENDEYVRRFIDEARIVVALNHANIANVFDVGRVREEYYLAMEHVAGVNVRAIQNRSIELSSAVPEGIATHITSMSLEALDYAHRLKHPMTGQSLNLVHRDVSPQNVMVSYEGEVKLIDFGLAESELKEEQTESQVVMGKVAYMAPEQARGEPVTPATDQFAMGVVLYELLVGERFYGTMNNYEIWQVVGRGGFVPQKWSELNPELAGILGKALHKDAQARFETCGDFYDALHAYQTKHHPSVNQRAVRKYMSKLFEDDHQRYVQTLQSFHDVSAASFQNEAERAVTVSLMNPLAGLDDDDIKKLRAEHELGAFANLSPDKSSNTGPASTLVDQESQLPPTLLNQEAAAVEPTATHAVDRGPSPQLMRVANVPGPEVSQELAASGARRMRIALVAMGFVVIFAVGLAALVIFQVTKKDDPPPKPVAEAPPPPVEPVVEDPKPPVEDPKPDPKPDPVVASKPKPKPKPKPRPRPKPKPVVAEKPTPKSSVRATAKKYQRVLSDCPVSCSFPYADQPLEKYIQILNGPGAGSLTDCAASCGAAKR
jgi:serine/threonine protein kinase